MYAVGSLSWMLASLAGGAMGDRYGTRRAMIVGGVLTAMGIAMLPMTETMPPALRTPWLLLWQVTVSAGWSLVMVNQIAAMMAHTTPENRNGAYAVREAMTGLGIFAGVLVGGVLPGFVAGLIGSSIAQPAPYRYALWVPVAMVLAGLAPLIMIRPATDISLSGGGSRVRPPLLPMILLGSVGFLNSGGVAICRVFGPAYLDQVFLLPPALIGAISSVGMALAVPAALSAPRLARRRGGSDGVLILASLGLTASLLLVGLVSHWTVAGVGIMGVLALAGMWMPSYQVLQMELAAPEWRAMMAGVASMAGSFGFGAASLGGGYMVAAAGYPRLFLLGAGFVLLSAVVTRRVAHSASAARQTAGKGAETGIE
jgi:predicted MFS family arabinose efflux permease